MLKFYHYEVSPRSQRVHFLLKRAEIPHEVVEVKMGEYEHREKAYQDKNPFGRVPCIDDEGFRLAESNTILRYLSRKHGLESLYPQDEKIRAQVEMWMDYGTIHIGNRMTGLAWQRHWLKKYRGEEGSQEIIASLLKDLNRDIPLLDAHLKEREYLLTGGFSLADISLYPLLITHRIASYSFEEFPSIQNWMRRVGVEPQWEIKH